MRPASPNLLAPGCWFIAIILLLVPSGKSGGAEPAGIGAKVPYVRYEAEDGKQGGTAALCGPNRNVGDLGGEASGRRAVKLVMEGDSVEWIASEAANSIVIRHSIPDTADGKGQSASLSVLVNGEKRGVVGLTSVVAWLYGPEAEPRNEPKLGSPRRIYDEACKLLDFVIQKGDRVMLRKDAGDTAEWYGIDFVELENVAPPLLCPEGFIDAAAEGITSENFGAKITGLIQSFEWKEGYKDKKGIFIPPGRYKMGSQAMINSKIAPGFEIRGAGMWHTLIYDDADKDADWGTPGFNMNGRAARFSDLAIFGAGRNRKGSGKPFFNSYGDGSSFTRIWVEHMTCGFWVGGGSGVTNNLTIDSCRLRNLGADGINLCNGTKNSTVVNTTVRSSGDDGIAIWSAPEMDGAAAGIEYPGCANNVVKNCTVELPWRASAFAIYGGKDNTIKDCIARDTLTYSGVNVSSTFKPRPFAGTTRVENLLLERCGGSFWNGQQFGALWVMADDAEITGVEFRNIEIVDPTFSGILLKSETYQKDPRPMNIRFEKVRVVNPGTRALHVVDAMGHAAFKDVRLAGSQLIVRHKDNNGKKGTGLIKLDAGEGCEGFQE